VNFWLGTFSRLLPVRSLKTGSAGSSDPVSPTTSATPQPLLLDDYVKVVEDTPILSAPEM